MPPEPVSAAVSWTLSDYANVTELVGFVITIIAFAFTIYQVRRSRTAAERAERAANAARSNLLRFDSISEISSAIGAMDGIQKLHRTAVWNELPERYALVRRRLIGVRASAASLTDEHKSLLQAAVTQLGSMEKQVEEYLSAGSPADGPDPARLNAVIARQADNLTQLLAEMKTGGDDALSD